MQSQKGGIITNELDRISDLIEQALRSHLIPPTMTPRARGLFVSVLYIQTEIKDYSYDGNKEGHYAKDYGADDGSPAPGFLLGCPSRHFPSRDSSECLLDGVESVEAGIDQIGDSLVLDVVDLDLQIGRSLILQRGTKFILRLEPPAVLCLMGVYDFLETGKSVLGTVLALIDQLL